MLSQFFSRELLLSLPPDNDEALLVIGEEFRKFDQSITTNKIAKHSDYVELLSLLKAFCEHRNLTAELPVLGTDILVNIINIEKVFSDLITSASGRITRRDTASEFQEKHAGYRDLFAGISAYEFSDQDYLRVQQLINELRDLISNSQLITSDHKRRLLRRLEAMQSELHKRSSDIDRFWGFIGEAGIAVRKFGEDIKPISERVQELGRIVIAVIFAKEGIQALPEITQLLTLKK
jgi:hypothetical protein